MSGILFYALSHIIHYYIIIIFNRIYYTLKDQTKKSQVPIH